MEKLKKAAPPYPPNLPNTNTFISLYFSLEDVFPSSNIFVQFIYTIISVTHCTSVLFTHTKWGGKIIKIWSHLIKAVTWRWHSVPACICYENFACTVAHPCRKTLVWWGGELPSLLEQISIKSIQHREVGILICQPHDPQGLSVWAPFLSLLTPRWSHLVSWLLITNYFQICVYSQRHL